MSGRARRATFSMFTSIPASPWCHHLIRSLAPRALLWHGGEHRLTAPALKRGLEGEGRRGRTADVPCTKLTFLQISWFSFSRKAPLPNYTNQEHNVLEATVPSKPCLCIWAANVKWKTKHESLVHQSLLEPTELLRYTENVWTWHEFTPWPNQGRCLGGKKTTPVPFLILYSETAVVF